MTNEYPLNDDLIITTKKPRETRMKLHKKLVASMVLAASATCTVLLPQTAYASETGQVSLIATLGKSPALNSNVVWKIFRHSTSLKEMHRIMKHSAVVDLPEGQYNIVASFEGITRKKNLWVKAGEAYDVVLNMR